jgi:hypothetical protein
MQSINLDKLKSESRIITFLGKDFELGYLPAGLAIPLVHKYQEILRKQTDLAGGESFEQVKALQVTHAVELENDAIELVAFFCSWFDQGYTPERVAQEATKAMVDFFFQEIIMAIIESSVTDTGSDESSGGSKKKSAGTGS